MTTLHAQPYDISANGFYFKSFEEYEAKAKAHKNDYGQIVEEYEIQFIEGGNVKLFDAANTGQSNLALWFEGLDSFQDDSDDGEALRYLLEIVGLDVEHALGSYGDVCIFEGSSEDYAYEYVDERFDSPKFAKTYFDYKKLAYDMELEGSIYELDYLKYVVNHQEF